MNCGTLPDAETVRARRTEAHSKLACLVLGWLTLAGLAFGQSKTSRIESPDISVIVNRNNPVNNLSIAELRKILLMEKKSWPDKSPIFVMAPAPGSAARGRVLSVILQMSEKDYKDYWVGRIYRGEVTGEPFEAASVQLINDATNSRPGAIAFLPAGSVRGENVKILRLENHLPGEPGYPLSAH